MKTLLLIPVFLFSLLFAQTESSKWYLGLQSGAGHTFRTLDPTDEAAAIVAEVRNSEEFPIIGMNGGIVFGRNMTGNLWFESGLQMSLLGHVFKANIDSSSFPSPPFPPPSNPSFTGELNRYNHFYHLNIPLLFKLYTNKGKVRGFFFYGPQVNLRLAERSRSVLTYDNGEGIIVTDLNANFNTLILSLVGGGGISFNPAERFSIELRGFARRDITPVADEPIRQQSFYVAGNLGGVFHF
jgi:hypothetical protein